MALEIFRLVGSVFVDTDKANKSLSNVDNKAQGFGKTLLTGLGTAAKWGAATVAAAAGVGAKFVAMAGDAETAFAKVKTLLDTDTDMEAYYQTIMDASNKTGVSFQDFSEAVYGAISASVDAADAVNFTTDAVKLAKGGFTSTATAVDVLTTAMNAYGLGADQAAHISDVLITTQNLGKTTVDELASSMGKTIPIANASGVSIEELSAQYAIMTKNGIATAEAGTGIKAMLGELSKSGSTTDKVLREVTKAVYGQSMSFADMQANGYSTADALALVSAAADKDGKSLKDMFSSSEAGAAALTLMKDGGDELTQTINAMATSAGAAETAYATMADTFEEKMAIVKTNLSNVAIEIGNTLMPIVQQLLDWVMAHMPEIQMALQVAFDVVSTVLKAVGDAVSWLTGIFDAHMPEIKAFTEQAFNGIKRVWDANLKPALTAIGDFITNVLWPIFQRVFMQFILPTVRDVFKGISDLWTGVLQPIFTGILNFLTGVFTGNWQQAWSGLVNIVSGVFNGIIGVVKSPINAVIGIINSFIRGLNSISIPSWVPGIGGKGIHISTIPYLAKGGVLERGQVGFLEGNGAEAVVPLDQNRKWIRAVAQDMQSTMGDGGKTEDLLVEILRMLTKIAQMGIYIDKDKLVGVLAGPMDRKLGLAAVQKARA